jgi:hypothetical protein
MTEEKSKSSVGKKESSRNESNNDDDFEQFDASQMSGLAEHIIYDLSIPITILAKESAMVPIDRWVVEGSPVLLFDPKLNEVNAIKAIHFKNTTPLVLANGSISVLEGGRFVSQSSFTPMLIGDDALIPYGYNTTVSITRKNKIETIPIKAELTYSVE